MSKLTQGHIDTLINWMLKNPGKPLNVSGTWRNNGYEVLNGYQTTAGRKAYKALKEQGYEVDVMGRCLISKRKLNKNDIDARAGEMITKNPDKEIIIDLLLEKDSTGITKTKPKLKAENTITKKLPEMLEKAMNIPIPPLIAYETYLSNESVQSIGKSLQGMIYAGDLMGKKAKVKVEITMEG